MRMLTRPVSITAYIAMAAAALLIPLCVFTILLFNQMEDVERRELGLRANDSARSLSFVVERRLADMATTLRLIAGNMELTTGDFRALHERTQRALSWGDLYLLAVDATGQQRLNTRVPYGTELGKTSDLETLQKAMGSRRIEVSDVFFGRTSSQWVFNVVYPVDVSSSSGIAALILTQNASDLAQSLVGSALPVGWSSAVVDQKGDIVAASGSEGKPGDQFNPTIRDFVEKQTDDYVMELDGQRMLIGSAAVSGWAWKIYVWGPEKAALQTLRTAWLRMLLGGAVLASIGAATAYVFARNLRRSILNLRDMATEISAGNVASPPSSVISELDLVAKSLSEASFDRNQADAKTFTVMRELAHRTKNLLAVVQSMVRQTAKQKQSVPALIAALGDRLSGLANSIDLLTASQWEGVSLKSLIEAHLAPFMPQMERIKLSGEDFLVRPDAVQPLGMAFHELATNAVKYGSLSTIAGNVDIRWTTTNDPDRPGEKRFQIRWAETQGPSPQTGTPAGFGTTVIEKHTALSLGGSVHLELKPEGLVWELHAPTERVLWRGREGEEHARSPAVTDQ